MPTLDFTTNKHPWVHARNARFAFPQYTGPASYATGGDPIDANDLKLGKIWEIFPATAIDSSAAIRHLVYDGAAGAMLWFDNADPHAEIANGTDLSDFTVKLQALEG